MLPSVTARSAHVSSIVELSRCRDRVPRRHITAARRNAKLRRQHRRPITKLYFVLWFSARSAPNLLRNIFAEGLMPPVHDNTKGTKDVCSTSRTRWSYFTFHAHDVGRSRISGMTSSKEHEG